MSYFLISLGSNIQAHLFLPKALTLISNTYELVSCSQVLTNPACGDYFSSPFHNQLLLIKSSQTSSQMKAIFERFEIQLGREAKSPERKFKDRTIDIDILAQTQALEDIFRIPLEETYNQFIMQEWQSSFPNQPKTAVHNDSY
ncbi:MAG: 2-amino-4-hydroxy-6-hydroxymethyldihydropteridine diphosphokinase [Oleispira sp.]|jgi:2-amino-4-hydroxy-6-hydroxymethyldihydropteridine diphosphokinase